MNLAEVFVLLLTLAAAYLLISERLRADLVALVVLVILGLSGILSPNETFAGFSGSAVMTILGISIISEGLRQTGVTQRLGNWMYRAGNRHETRLIAIAMLASAGLSLFMNNIAAVGVLLPAVMALARMSKTAPSRLLLPLAYGTTLGGMATLLTTANIIVSGALKDAGFRPFGLLDFLPIGLPIVVVGVGYMLVVGRRMLPAGLSAQGHHTQQLRQQLESLYDLSGSRCAVEVLPESPLAEKTLAGGDWAQRTGLNVLAILHNGQAHFTPDPQSIVHAGDLLLAQGQPNLAELCVLGLRSRPIPAALSLTDEAITLAELVIPPHSALIGQTLRQASFRERFNLNVIALWREGRPHQNELACLPLRCGDALLVLGSTAHVHLLGQQTNLLLLEEDPDAVAKPGKARLALWVTLLTLGVASLGALPVAVTVMAGAVILLLTGCLRMSDIYQSVEWKAIFLIAGMWPLSTAIRSTGLAAHAIQALLAATGQVAPLVIAAIFILIALLFTQFMSGQVAALVLAPLALAAASQIGADPRSMGMAVALGCSLAFPTPFGHPVNIMVMGPGGYTFKDYLRIGAPLTLLVFLTLLAGLRLFWGL